MNISFGDVSVTTWAVRDGRQVWRARTGEQFVEFFSPRDAEVDVLHAAAVEALTALN